MNKVLVIGNGPSIINYEIGNKIDEFDCVVRLNNYITKGYEKNVGSKTSIWATGGGLNITPRDVSVFNDVWVFVPAKFYKTKIGRKKSAKATQDGEYNLIDKQIIIDADETLHFSIEENTRCSTGFYVIFYAMTKFEKVYIHGFDCFQTCMPGSNITAQHYYGPSVDMVLSCHKPIAEKNYLAKMIKEEKLFTII